MYTQVVSANHDPTPQATDVGLVLNKTTLDKHRREVDAVVTDVVHGNRDKAISGSIRLLVRALEIPVVGSALAAIYERLAKSSSQAKFEAEVQEQEREEALRALVAEAVLPTLVDCQKETQTLVDTYGLAVIKRLDDLASLLNTYLTAPIQEAVSAEEAQKLQRLLDASESLLARKPNEDEPVGALQLALITKAFGEAAKKHHQATEHVAISNLESRLEAAALAVLKPGENPGELLADLQRLTGQPLRSPYYLALWNAFTKPEPGQSPPLKFEGGGARDFEAAFRQAYIAALSTPDGQRVQQWKIALSAEKPAALRHALMEDLAGWGHRHVLGNVLTQSPHDILPFMPLDQVYVEPNGRLANTQDQMPIKALIKRQLEDHHIVVIKADFGNGKSLTARSLAKDLAQRWLSDHANTGANLPVPVFVKCSRDILGDSYNHGDSIRRSLYNHGNDELCVNRPVRDEIFTPPDLDQETLFIFDGLDEISWGKNQIRDLLAKLREEVRGSHRAIVFTRPGALNERRVLPKGASVIELLGFDSEQVLAWIDKWNALPMQEKQLAPNRVLETDLSEIARTPILLLLIAVTLSPKSDEEVHPELKITDLYKSFFEQIARGKLKQDCDEHGPITKASDELLTCLTSQNPRILDLVPSSHEETRESQRIEAMLWLMSRVAWEAHERNYRVDPVPLRISEIEVDILDRELGLGIEVRSTIELGLILTMQIDPANGAEEILFGHQSFREFLVAYFWNHELQRLSRSTRREQETIEDCLMKARLIQREDASLRLLLQLAKTNEHASNAEIHSWAQDTINSEELSSSTLRDDLYSNLRETALAVGSSIGPLELADEQTLLTLLAYFHAKGSATMIYAPGLRSPDANLYRANLSGAYLREADLPRACLEDASLQGANLEGANLKEAWLTRVNFQNATLKGANFEDAYLEEANFQGANLHGVNLRKATIVFAKLQLADLNNAKVEGADFEGAELHRAILVGAHLDGAKFGNAELNGAQLRDAHLARAIFKDADCESADFRGARLQAANFSNTNLSRARLQGACLYKTDLSGADLSGANLSDADLSAANLDGANLSGAKLNGTNFTNANLSAANCIEADFSKAILTGATLPLLLRR